MDENNVIIREDTLPDAITPTEVKLTTNKANTPDKYHENKRKLKAFLI